jgi:hypothetical protein
MHGRDDKFLVGKPEERGPLEHVVDAMIILKPVLMK